MARATIQLENKNVILVCKKEKNKYKRYKLVGNSSM